MNIERLLTFIQRAGEQARSLDSFVEEQRAVAGAVRSRDWPRLEQALERAASVAESVSFAEASRAEAWAALLDDLGQAQDATVFRASLSLPVEYRSTLNDAYRGLRLSAMRARIENDALSGFVGSAAATLRQAVETLFPDRKGRMYGKTGKPHHAESGAMILDRAL